VDNALDNFRDNRQMPRWARVSVRCRKNWQGTRAWAFSLFGFAVKPAKRKTYGPQPAAR
jgi:hypothetical protein